MGSHYIPVGKLKIDKDLLDFACPAAGYSSTPPDPAIYCPANGYSETDNTYKPPIELPDPGSGEIHLLCDDMAQGVIAFYCRATSGSCVMELYNTDMVLLDSVVALNTFRYDFPTQRTGTHYIVKFYPQNSGEFINAFYRTSYSPYALTFNVYWAKFNTPEMGSLYNCFNAFNTIKRVEFLCNMNSLTSMANMFQNSSIQFVQFPSEMTSLTTMAYMFNLASDIKIITLADTLLSSLDTVYYMFRESGIKKIVLPEALPSLTNFQSFAYKSYLQEITLPTSMNTVTNIAGAFSYCANLQGTFIFPEMPLCVSMSSVFGYSPLIERVSFTGVMNLCTSIDTAVRDCFSLKEITLPTSMNAVAATSSYFAYNCHSLRKITMPLNMTLYSGSISVSNLCPYTLEEMTECDFGANVNNVQFQSHKLKTLYQPTLRANYLIIGYSSSLKAPLTSVEIDWANSTFSGSSPQIKMYAALNAAELDRIGGLVPTISGKIVDVRYCDGYATMDKTIWTAKGWTVL